MGYRWANKPYEANNMLLNTATIRRDTIELMQNAASTASAAEYPSKSIADIAVEFLCVLCGSRSAQSAGLSDRMTCQTQPFDHPRIFAVADGLLSRLDTLDSAGPAESVSQTQPKTGAGLASCDVTTRIERLGGFGCMRSGDGQSACQYLESNADQRAAQLSTAPANDCANGIDDPSHLKPLSGACRKASGQASAADARRLALHDIRYFQRLLRHSGGLLRDSRASPEAISMSPGSD
jgi:hypothetical protein